LDKKSETLKVLQHLRDEAHRFGITFHRTKRSEKFTSSELLEISGLGPKSVEKLLAEFKSMENLKSVPLADLSRIVGKERAVKVIDFLKGH
jgi:excinuclease ABC subunit C